MKLVLFYISGDLSTRYETSYHEAVGEDPREEKKIRMSLTVRHYPETNIVESILSGVVTPSELRVEIIQAAALAEANDCTLFLSNFSEATINFSIIDVFDLPKLQEEQGLQRNIRVAVLPPTSTSGKEMADFYETVCYNRGWNSKVFSGRQEALNWLRK